MNAELVLLTSASIGLLSLILSVQLLELDRVELRAGL